MDVNWYKGNIQKVCILMKFKVKVFVVALMIQKTMLLLSLRPMGQEARCG